MAATISRLDLLRASRGRGMRGKGKERKREKVREINRQRGRERETLSERAIRVAGCGSIVKVSEPRSKKSRHLRSIFTDCRVQTERLSENSSRGKQGNLFQKKLQGVSAKSHTILSAVNVCVALVLHCRTKYLKTSECIIRSDLLKRFKAVRLNAKNASQCDV